MEISKSAQEVLTQAQMLKLNTRSDTVYVEFLLYGLVLMSRYLDEPMNKSEYLAEAKKVRKLLEKKINSIAMAENTLRETAGRDTSGFHNDPTVLSKAVEIAGSNPISALDLAKAVLEKSDSTITWLNSQEILPFAEENDAKYKSKKPPVKPNQNPVPQNNQATVFDNNATVLDNNGTVFDNDVSMMFSGAGVNPNLDQEKQRLEKELKRLEEDRKLLEKDRKRFEEEHKKFEEEQKKFEEARKKLDEDREQFDEQKKILDEERIQLDEDQDRLDEARDELQKDKRNLAEREKRLSEQKLNLEKERKRLEALQAEQEAKKKPKWTFIGPFEFRGSTFWGYLQYFLWGVVISCGALFALEHFTHYVTQPPTKWWSFGINAFIVISVYYHLRGITYWMETKWPAWSLFTRQFFDLCLIAALMSVYVFEFSVPSYFPTWRRYVTGRFLTFKPSPLPYVPRWLKYVGGVFAVLVFSVGTVIYNGLQYSIAACKKSIKHGNYEGPVAKVIFQSISGNLIFPMALLVGIWAYNKPFKVWHIKVFWIYGFLAVWTLGLTILMCLDSACQSSWYRGKQRKFVRFLYGFYIFLFVPLMVLFLHWLFGWFPMKVWVMAVLGAYTLFTFLGMIGAVRD